LTRVAIKIKYLTNKLFFYFEFEKYSNNLPGAWVKLNGTILSSVTRRTYAVALTVIVNALTVVHAWRREAAVDRSRWGRCSLRLIVARVFTFRAAVALRAYANAHAVLVQALATVQTWVTLIKMNSFK
jgi:hypothetical protein